MPSLDATFGGGQTWNAGGEVKSDPPESEVIVVPDFGTITTTLSGATFSWTSTFGIDAVLFKVGQGNDGYNTFFVYAPTAASPEAFSGSGTNGSPTGLSHVSFCFDANNPPTPTPTPTRRRRPRRRPRPDRDADPATRRATPTRDPPEQRRPRPAAHADRDAAQRPADRDPRQRPADHPADRDADDPADRDADDPADRDA